MKEITLEKATEFQKIYAVVKEMTNAILKKTDGDVLDTIQNIKELKNGKL